MKRTGILLFLVLSYCGYSYGQLSPGDLAQAHSQLEGISNCTKCHVLGEKLTNTKCLDCHTEIKNAISTKDGYHASKEVQGKFCYTCHSDHHGKQFQLVRFDRNSFNHSSSGYTLEGKHKAISCNDCHKKEFIHDEKLRSKKSTWLGLSKDCRNCHQDFHQGTLPANCASCHNFNSFKPATGFDHQKTAFRLKGKHAQVDCNKCHPSTTRQGEKFVQYTGIKFTNCTNCHKDPHNNSFGQNCKSCHNEESFQKLVSTKSFDHSRTAYPLTGKHQTVSCVSCHKGNYSQSIPHSQCADCHKDYHQNQFRKNGVNPDCNDCHSTDGFNKTSFSVERHEKSSFPLVEKHREISCASCHKKSGDWQFRNVGNSCKDCHVDYHKNEFQAKSCEECHDNKSFSDVRFTIAQHNLSFPLEGAHLATPCSDCHKKNNQNWTFRTGKSCVSCHPNIHKGFIKENFYPNQECRKCHNTNSWKEIGFDHSLTSFPLKGRHQVVSCESCHTFKKSNGSYIQQFTLPGKECQSCHKDVHSGQFEKNGETSCNDCHVVNNWKPELFNHDNTGFNLGKAHEKLKCTACHEKNNTQTGSFIKFQTNKTKCADCHS